MIFKTMPNELNGVINKVGILNRSFADLKNAMSVNGIRGLFNGLSPFITSKDISNINEYNRLVSVEGLSSQTAWYRTMLSSSKAAQLLFEDKKNLIKTDNGLILSEKTLTQATNSMTLAAKTASIGLKTFSIAGNMLVMWGISEAISAIVTAVDEYSNRVQYAQERLDTFNETVTNSKNELRTQEDWIKEHGKRYEELSHGIDNYGHNVSLTTDEMNEYNSLTRDIQSMFPSMVTGYNEQNNAIIRMKGSVEALTESYKANVNAAHADVLTDASKNFGDYKTSIEDAVVSKNSIQSLIGTEKITGYLQQNRSLSFEIGDVQYDFSKVLGNDIYDELVAEIKQTKHVPGIVGRYDFNFSNLSAGLQKKIRAALTTADATIKTETSKIKPILEAFVYGNSGKDSGYDKLSEEGKQVIRNVVSSLDDSFYTQFDSDTDMASYFFSHFIEPLKDGLDNTDLAVKINSLFSLNQNDYSSYQDYVNAVNDIINQIRESRDPKGNLLYSEEQIDGLKNLFGIGKVNANGDLSGQDLIDVAKDKYSSIDGADDYIATLNEKELRVLYDLEPNESKSLDDLKHAIANLYKEAEQETSTVPLSFKQAWNSIGTSGDEEKDKTALETKEKLLELAEAGKLTKQAFRNSSIADDFLNQTKLSAEEATQKINELISSADQLASMKTGISSISTILGEKKENQSSKKTRTKGISADTLAGMPDDIKEQTKEYEYFVEVLGDGTKEMDDCRDAANKLATAYITSNNFLSNLTKENKDYYKSVLKEMGVENAAEVVTAALNKQKVNAKISTFDMKNSTEQEISTLGSYVKSLDDSSKALAYYTLQQQIANNNALDTSDSVKNLLKLAKQCGITGEAILILKSLISNMQLLESGQITTSGLEVDTRHAGEAQNHLEDEISSAKKRLKKIIKKGMEAGTSPKVTPKSSSGSKSGSKKEKSDKSKSTQQFDWINRSLDRLSSRLDLIKAKYDNLFNNKKAKDSDSLLKLRNKNLDKQYKLLVKTVRHQEKAQKKYTKKADGVRISKDKKEDASLKKAVREGRIKSKSMNKLIHSYGEPKAEKIQKYQEWYDKAREAEKNKISAQTSRRENRIQKYQNLADTAEQRKSLAQAGKENAGTAEDKNGYIEQEKESIETSYEYQIRIARLKKDSLEADRLMAEKTKELLDLEIEQHQNLADKHQSLLDQYSAEKELAANASKKNAIIAQEQAATKDLYAEKIAIAGLEGNISEQQQLQAEQSKQLRDLEVETHQNLVDEYQAELDKSSAEKENVKTSGEKNAIVDREKQLTAQLYAEKIKIAECEGSITEKQQLQAEFTRQMLLLEKEKFDHISHYYENLMRRENNAYTDLKGATEELEARGLAVSGKLYESQIAINNEKKKLYEKELLSLNEQLHSIEQETDEWYDAVDAIQSCKNGIAELTRDTQTLAQASRNVSFELSDKIISRYDLISSEYDLLIEFMSGKNHTDDKTGIFTKEGTATLGAYYAKLLLAKNEMETFQASMSDMYQKLQSGEKGYTDQKAWDEYYGYMDKAFQLEKAYYGLRQDMAGQMEKRYTAELECLQDIINKRKELLQTEKDEYDYRRTIEEKTKNIGTLAKQIQALNGDDSEAARTKLQQLRVSLDDAQKDLQDTEYDRWLSDQQTMLDDLYNEFHDFIDGKLSDTDALFNEALTYLKEKDIGAEISDVLHTYADTYGHTYSPDFMNIQTALGKEGDIVKAITGVSATISEKYQNQLKATQDAGNVIRLISEIGQVDYDGEGRKRLIEAENAYHSLSPEAKSIVDTTSVNGLTTLKQKQTEWVGITEARKQETARAEQAAAQQRLEAENQQKREAFKNLIRRTYLADAHTYANTSTQFVSNLKLDKLLMANGLFREDNYPLSEAGVKSIMTQLGFSRSESHDMDSMYNYMKNIGFSEGGIAQTIQNVPGMNGDHGWATLTKGEAVLTPQQAKDFKILAQNLNVLNPAVHMLQHLSGPNVNAVSPANSTTIGDVHVTVDLPNVTNYDEFKQKMQSDPKIEQMFKSMIWDKGSLSKYRINVR